MIEVLHGFPQPPQLRSQMILQIQFNYNETTSFHILSRSLFSNNTTTQCHIIWVLGVPLITSETNKKRHYVVSRSVVMCYSCRTSGNLWFGIVGALKNWNSSLQKSVVRLIKINVLNKIVIQGYSRNITEYWLINTQKEVNVVGVGR
jgi:hypothetical protein